MLPAAALVRLRGGSVSRIGVGARNFAPIPRAMMWPSNALSSYSRWRDDRTAAYLGFGSAMPDLGFEEGMSGRGAGLRRRPTRDRDVMVVSLRDDTEVAPRPYPGPAWLDGIRAFADRREPEALGRHAGVGRRRPLAPPGARPRRANCSSGPSSADHARAGRAPAGALPAHAASRRATGCTSSSPRSPRAPRPPAFSSTTPTRCRATSRRSASRTSRSTPAAWPPSDLVAALERIDSARPQMLERLIEARAAAARRAHRVPRAARRQARPRTPTREPRWLTRGPRSTTWAGRETSPVE